MWAAAVKVWRSIRETVALCELANRDAFAAAAADAAAKGELVPVKPTDAAYDAMVDAELTRLGLPLGGSK